MKKAYLVLGDGRVFAGERIGAERDGTGELVFTTGMVGYVETLTDPSYAGQIVMQTFPLIGNVGMIEADFEGECAVRGYVVRECCAQPSNFRCGETLDAFLKRKGIPGICGVDTRELTRIIREEGVMNARICAEVPSDTSDIASYAVRGVVAQVSRRGAQVYPAEGERRFSVTLLDYGAKRNIIRSLCRRGCEVTAVGQDTPAEVILASHPDGVMLSNGPGDPAVHDLVSGRTYITSQNHGYAVLSGSLEGVGVQTFVNANDGSCEGMEYPGQSCFTVQFHPEACGGPHDTEFLFDRFLSRMEEWQHAKG